MNRAKNDRVRQIYKFIHHITQKKNKVNNCENNYEVNIPGKDSDSSEYIMKQNKDIFTKTDYKVGNVDTNNSMVIKIIPKIIILLIIKILFLIIMAIFKMK